MRVHYFTLDILTKLIDVCDLYPTMSSIFDNQLLPAKCEDKVVDKGVSLSQFNNDICAATSNKVIDCPKFRRIQNYAAYLEFP